MSENTSLIALQLAAFQLLACTAAFARYARGTVLEGRTNDYKGEVRWEDMFIEEFIPYIETQYRIRRKKEFRGIAGLSMGGYGSLVTVMRHPDLFGATAAFSSAVLTDAEMETTPLAFIGQSFHR